MLNCGWDKKLSFNLTKMIKKKVIPFIAFLLVKLEFWTPKINLDFLMTQNDENIMKHKERGRTR